MSEQQESSVEAVDDNYDVNDDYSSDDCTDDDDDEINGANFQRMTKQLLNDNRHNSAHSN